MTNRIANLLRHQGVKKGDIVAIYMPVSPMAVASMLACARIGAIHSVIFAGFSSKAIASRIQDMEAVAVITANEGNTYEQLKYIAIHCMMALFDHWSASR